MRSVELFAGAGGLALGCELAGFRSAAVVEWDRWACDTVRQNAASQYPLVSNWNVIEGDVRHVDWTELSRLPIDLVAGGPPCQPFSLGGKARAADDKRDMFPAATEAIRALKPKAFIVENVKGLTRAAFADYYEYILLRLAHPEIASHVDEDWYEHLVRLKKEDRIVNSDLQYHVVPTVVNAANYGVPQQRHRVFMVGFRSDIEAKWSFPQASHSKVALEYEKYVTGEYWDRHGIATKSRPAVIDESLKLKISRLAEKNGPSKPWRTVRDAIGDLPEPTVRGTRGYRNHVLQPGARSYPGHTGSFIDLPAKTLKAGGHGVPGGENMLRNVDGSVRYFTVRESARLQTFPDGYELHGAWGEAMRQLGNAVPVLLAQKVASSVAEHLLLSEFHSKSVSSDWVVPPVDRLATA